MAKVTLTDLTSLANDTSATNSINTNFQTLEDYINDNVLSRDANGETNTIQNDIDFNNYDILNITEINGTDVDQLLSDYAAATLAAQVAQAAAELAETNAETAETNAETAQTAAEAAQTAAELALDTFDDIFLGAKASAPALDNDGDALATGALYWNTGNDTLYIWDDAAWNTAAFDTSGALLDTDLGVTVQAYDADTSKTDVEQTYTAAQTGSTQTNATATGNITLDFSTYNNFILTLTGNVTLDNPSTETVGQSGFITFIQDGTGSRTVTLGTDYETPGGAGITLTGTASTTDVVGYCVVASGRILLGSPVLDFS